MGITTGVGTFWRRRKLLFSFFFACPRYVQWSLIATHRKPPTPLKEMPNWADEEKKLHKQETKKFQAGVQKSNHIHGVKAIV